MRRTGFCTRRCVVWSNSFRLLPQKARRGVTTDGLPGFPKDCPDIMGRDLPTVSNARHCDGGDLPPVWDESVPRAHESAAVKAASLAEQARELVDGERQSDYGEPVEHVGSIAAACSAVLGRP